MSEKDILTLCPYCNGRWEGAWEVGIQDRCGTCKGKGVVNQKARMKYVRQFRGMTKEQRITFFMGKETDCRPE